MGSGFKIGMLDLEIRGAGNLLGREQHGHMLTVGFDLYCKILEDEVDRLSKARGEEEKVVPVELSLGFEALIPEHYIEDVITKVEIYKRIADLRDKQALLLLMDELKERFGKPPEEVENLFILAGIRILAMACHLERIRKDRNSFILTPKKGWYLFEDLQDIRRKFKGRVFFRDNSMVLSEDKIYLLEFFLRELVSLKG